MPKKSKRESQKLRKKKVSTADFSADNPLANTVINIVDPGESGIDITEEIRRKEEAAKKLVLAPNIVSNENQTFIQTKEEVQAIRKELKGDEIVSKIDEFALLKPRSEKQNQSNQENSQTYLATTSLAIDNVLDKPDSQEVVSSSLMTQDSQIADSLAVNIGSVNPDSESYSRQTTMESSGSVSSSFSYFSDSNLVQKGDISPNQVEQAWSQAENSFSSQVQEGVFSSSSGSSIIQTQTVIKSSKKISKKQIISSEYGNESDIFIESALETDEESIQHMASGNVTSDTDTVETKKRSHVSPDPGPEGDVFLEELKSDILENEEKKEIVNKKRQHISPKPADDDDVFLEKLKDDVLDVNEEISMLEDEKDVEETKEQTEIIEKKELESKEVHEKKTEKKQETQRKSLGWDNIFIKKEIKLELKTPDSSQSITYSEEDDDQWKEQLKKIKRNGVTLEERTLHTYFEEVETKVFDTELGYGLVSENKGQPKIKIVLKGNSPFLNNDKVRFLVTQLN